jgi:FtsP/CotA-like multicopper oxidase with cupredoxin domain
MHPRRHMPWRATLLGCIAALFWTPGHGAAAQSLVAACARSPEHDRESRGASRDLYCIDLLPARDYRASGTAELRPPSSPFGLPMHADGSPQWTVAFSLDSLPDPSSLGPYTTYVAWAAMPSLQVEVKLGAVGRGLTTRGPLAFDQFLLLITAERDSAVSRRSGPLVLRGASASTRLQPDDLAFLLSGMLPEDSGAGAGAADAHAHHTTAEDSTAWTAPPMHPTITMPPELMRLRPAVTPYRPRNAEAPLARPRELVRLADGDTLRLTAAPVRRLLFGRTVTMLGFNEQYPGPLIHVAQGSKIFIDYTNRTDFPGAVHWHGVRLDNRFDGVPHVTQELVPPGGSFRYEVYFPDAGIYWYHPHHREDVLQDLGLYGNMLVDAAEPDYYGPAHDREILMLDDLLLADSGLVEWGLESPTHALMGRFGNVMLVNGEPRWESSVRRGEVVRFFLTNVSNVRVFNLSWQSGAGGRARMKVVASDLGRYEREQWVENIVIAPAERYVVDVRFEDPGAVALVNRVHAIDPIFARFLPETDTLGLVRVGQSPASPDFASAFDSLRRPAAVAADMARYRAQFDRPVDHELLLTLALGNLPFPLQPLLNLESVYRNPVEWSGTMPEMDWLATGREVRWILRDRATDRENMDVAWRFRVGEVVKLRLVNDRTALHSMHHPIHIHGQRFLVVAVNGVPNEHLVWKDTMLLPAGFSADILLELSNPGRWMLHCHIAEHLEAGMRMVFEVVE